MSTPTPTPGTLVSLVLDMLNSPELTPVERAVLARAAAEGARILCGPLPGTTGTTETSGA